MPSNQTNKADSGKGRPSLLLDDLGKPLSVVQAVLDYGAEKYEDRGWRTVSPLRYREAMLRHDRDFFVDGEAFDRESGLHHLAHDICNRLFMLYALMEENPNMDYTHYNKPPQSHKQ